ncbi:ectoine hydroxylase [Saccharopolyspora antimicrobica]|uniref:Ectoine hydroxylase n=2 Tax=Saccharopolyspora TaxID=1835 RepID=A0A1I5G9N8_9PSEU|nr:MULTISPECIES: ectoine hydroxylase [Saccharopolyspora]RKT83859.1 ectoine hydroxylase [Saccharopolyspora antimicrobica]SEG97567.1 ectoine hydroxylase [Saccharopolyspora kobensis]SFE94169.1 ectoine hydroxylase [Saccharopolyspora kobensis]SFO32666.1 ectoine hydroxylase [Saccharopolyspora antimicrobica]
MTVAELSTQDRYPTRVGAEPSPIDRDDPTVWPGVDAGPASAAELRSHEVKGFHVVEGLLSPAEVQTYWQELERLTSDPAVRADERTIVERSSDEVRSIFEVHRTSELIAELARDPRVLDRARQILGSDVYVHQSRINYMPGYRGTGFYWHSDFETWHAEDGMPAMRAVSISIALTDNYAFNGGLMIMPGSHRTFVPCAGETPEDNYKSSLKEQRVGVPSEEAITRMAYEHGIEQFTGPAGSALWFDSNCMHASGNNITPFPRSNIFIVFNSVENTLERPFAAQIPRPRFIASQDHTPLTR